MKHGKVYIGTSGWKYAHWNGTFYPDTLKKKDQLKYFTEHFDSVELNNSFYRQPKPEHFADWFNQVPQGFIYSVKANRYFTHLKKLKVTTQDLSNFLIAAENLQTALGPILFQLPPRWKINVERFETFLKILPQGFRYVFEFREQSWYHETIYQLLSTYNCAFCIYELDGHQSPILTTADFVYIRLHGPGAKYQGSYDNATLIHWKNKCLQWTAEGKDVYVYFDNDQLGYAAFNAEKLKQMIRV